jgi:hypothetical protein
MVQQLSQGVLPDVPEQYDASAFRKAFNVLQTFMTARSKAKLVFQVANAAAVDFSPTSDVLSSHYDGDCVVTIPLASLMIGREIVIKNSCDHAGAHHVTITPSGSDTIDGATSEIITSYYGCRRLYSDGEKWHIIGSV